MRKNPGAARSINSYLETIALTTDDKEYICKITSPIGWCAKFEGGEDLTDDEQIQKSKILNSITKFPTVEVNNFLKLHAIHQIIKLPTTSYRIPIFKHLIILTLHSVRNFLMLF